MQRSTSIPEYRRIFASPNYQTIAGIVNGSEQSVFIHSVDRLDVEQVSEDSVGSFNGIGLTHLSWAPDASRFLTCSKSGNVGVWTLGRLKPDFLIREKGVVSHGAFDPSGEKILTCCSDGSARLRDASTGKLLVPEFRHGRNIVFRGDFLSNGRLAWSQSLDGVLKLWDSDTGYLVDIVEHLGKREIAGVHPESEFVLLPGSNKCRTLDMRPFSKDEGWLRSYAEILSCRRVNRTGGVELLTDTELQDRSPCLQATSKVFDFD